MIELDTKGQFQLRKINWIYRTGLTFIAVAGRELKGRRIVAPARYSFTFAPEKRGGGEKFSEAGNQAAVSWVV